MSSIILVNDLFEELSEENERLKQTIDLMVKYRICLIDFKDNCNCDKNRINKMFVDYLEKEWSQLEDNEGHQRSQHQPVISRSSIGSQTDNTIVSHQLIGHNLTTDEITGGHRSNEQIIVIDDSSSDEDSDVFPLVRNAIESDGEDVAEGMNQELIPTADTSNTLRLTLVKTRRSTTRVVTDSVGNRNDQLKCGQSGCNRSFVNKWQLSRHTKTSHQQLNPYSCSLCPNTYQNGRQLGIHYNSCHSESTVGQLSAMKEKRERNRCRLPDGRGYRCHRTDCRQVFISIKGFTTHMRSHRGDYRFGCNECHQKFVDSSRLKQHKQCSHIKSNTNAFECKYTDCHYKTVRRLHLNRHQLTHENKRSFKCPFNGCNYRTNTNDNLREHKVNRHGFYRRKHISR